MQKLEDTSCASYRRSLRKLADTLDEEGASVKHYSQPAWERAARYTAAVTGRQKPALPRLVGIKPRSRRVETHDAGENSSRTRLRPNVLGSLSLRFSALGVLFKITTALLRGGALTKSDAGTTK